MLRPASHLAQVAWRKKSSSSNRGGRGTAARADLCKYWVGIWERSWEYFCVEHCKMVKLVRTPHRRWDFMIKSERDGCICLYITENIASETWLSVPSSTGWSLIIFLGTILHTQNRRWWGGRTDFGLLFGKKLRFAYRSYSVSQHLQTWTHAGIILTKMENCSLYGWSLTRIVLSPATTKCLNYLQSPFPLIWSTPP